MGKVVILAYPINLCLSLSLPCWAFVFITVYRDVLNSYNHWSL